MDKTIAVDILDDLFGSSEDEIDDHDIPVEGTDSMRLSTVVEMRDIGGSRGLVSICRIPPGVLLLAETPAVTWKENKLEEIEDLIVTIEACLMNKVGYEITKTLHPKFLKDCDEEELDNVKALIDSNRIEELALKTGIEKEEILRVLLVLQHNGFGSGLYGVLTMLNHSCNPNCIKFPPSVGSSGASEIWTVRQIEKGEECTICYCEPLEMTKQSMGNYLEKHHRFSCKCSDCKLIIINENNAPHEILDVIQRTVIHENKLQEIIVGMEQELQFLRDLSDLEVGFESVSKLMKATTDLSEIESLENIELNSIKISPRILARLHKLSTDSAATFLEYANMKSDQRRKPKEVLVKYAAFSFLRNSLCLLKNQTKYLDNNHPNIASTNIDIAEALDCALLFFPEDLIMALNLPINENCTELRLLKFKLNQIDIPLVLVTKKMIKKESSRFRSEGNRIKSLYLRRHFLTSYISLRESSCYWGDNIPSDHMKLLSDTVL
jgi:Zn-finger protein